MKKSLLLSAIVAGVLGVAHPAPAKTVLMSQDFNSAWSTTNPPPGWRIYFDEGDTSYNDWHRGPDTGLNRWPDNPTPYAMLDSSPSEIGDDSLISPLVNCAGCNSIVLRCSTYFKGSLRMYRAKLLGAVDGGEFDYQIFDYNGMTIGPALQDFDLSWAVGHSQVQVAWFFGDLSDGISYWAIDDVSITGDTVTDNVGCVAILAPIDTVDSNFVITPQAIFKNYNTTDPVTFPVQMTIGSSYIATDTVHDLVPGESTTVDFASWTAAPRGNLPVEAMTVLRGDIDPSNDTVRGSVYVRVRDVGCIAITAPRDTIDSGLQVQPMARIRNFGTDTATFCAYFSIGAWTGVDTIVDMSPGDEWEVVFPAWPANASFWVTARCSTAWSVDPYARNDTASGRFFVKPPHYKDVAAVRILQPPGIVGENSTVTPSGVIRSYCDDPQSATAYFSIYSGAVVVYAESSAQTIQPGESLVVNFPEWIAGPLGQFTDTLRVWLDGDANAENDVVGSQFEVQSEFHDVGVAAITSPADTVFAGPVTPGAYARNYGLVVETFFAKCRVLRGLTTVYYDSAAVTALHPGESTLVAFPVWTATAGSYTVRCSTDVPGDVNPANDWLEKHCVVIDLPPPPGWKEFASMPLPPGGKDIKDGGWLVYDRGVQLVFGTKGYKQTDFFAYFPLGDTWKALKAIPLGTEQKPPSKGAYGCTDGNGTLYATKGNNKLGFYRYSYAGDSWHQLKDVPLGINNKKVKGGTGLQYCLSNGAAYVYLLKGYKNEFYRYHIDGDTWHALPNAPGEKWDKGSWIVYDGAHAIYAHMGKRHLFYAYDTDTDVWFDTLTAMPIPGANGEKKSKDGSCATWYDASILALKGGNTQEFWRYFMAGDTWHQLDTIPKVGASTKRKKIKAGAGIVSVGGNVFYATKGNKCREFWRYRLAGNVDVREDYAAVALPAGCDGLSIAPNPATGNATVRLPAVFAASSSIRVYDVRGNLVMERTVAASSLRLDCRSLAPGVYFVHARSPRAQATCRLVKD